MPPPLHIPDQTLPPMARHGSVAQRPIFPRGSLQVHCIPQAWTHATRHASATVVTSSRFAALRTLRAPPVGPPPPPDTDLSLAPQFRLFQNVPQLEPDGPLSGARAQGAPAPSQGWPARFFHLPRTSRLLPSFGNHVRGRHTHLWTGFRVDTFSAPRVNIIGARDCWVTP